MPIREIILQYVSCTNALKYTYKLCSLLCVFISFPRYLLQYYVAPQDTVLYSEPHCAMRWHLLPLSASVLLAGRLGREDSSLHLNPSLPNYVLPAHIRDHPINVASPATTRQVSSVHYDPRRTVCSYNHNGSQRPLPQT